ncbi:hypothetical protein DRQ16_00320 [bacterium]|nr:MAG: hypothetical protein DRQ18_03620 [bacterium]RKZ24255.1 MAG: hypothetical protein DRQ16_00320 [bacterium]
MKVEIPDSLYRMLEERAQREGMEVEKFIIKLLSSSLENTLEIDPEEKEEIKKRLRELGYL